MKYLSHLDLTRALPRAFRRAGIKLGYSQGFHPMPLIQYGPALGVGTVGERELIDFDSLDELEEREFIERINANLPAGFRFKRLERLPASAQALIKDINRAEYSVSLDAHEIHAAIERLRGNRPDIDKLAACEIHNMLADEFIMRDSCVIDRVRKDKRQKIDVRRYTKYLGIDAEMGDLRIVTEISPNGGVKPVEVMAAVYDLTGEEKISLGSRVRRLRLYSEGLGRGEVTPQSRDVAATASAQV